MKEFVEKLIEQLINACDECIGWNHHKVNAYSHAIGIVKRLEEEYSANTSQKSASSWIPCSERLPEDGDNRFYMCIVENHEEDVPMFCQYCEDHGFGFWHDFYDEHTLGFLDSEFKTNEELGYEKVIAWQPLPEPYKPKEQQEEV